MGSRFLDRQQLIQRCEAGEAGAIEEFVRSYQPDAYRLASRSGTTRTKRMKSRRTLW